MTKPTLHEIAAMPFPASALAVRQHYDPKWHTDVSDEPRKFRCRGEWTISGRLDAVIEAESKDEAKELAAEYAMDDAHSGSLDFYSLTVEEIEE